MYLRFKSSLIGFNPSLLFPGNLQNYYNPFNPETWIPYQLAVDTEVSLMIYNSRGKQISAQELGFKKTGDYRSREKAIYWDGRNQLGEPVTSGVYFYRLEAGDYRQIRQMVILK
ncbi:hypothetical protein CMK14_10735 [Candidatus Poribacteria bacterium]|nr:hypothetical protein [Candidatus Poribacteria bacterium]